MDATAIPAVTNEVERLEHARAAELLRSNEALREEVRQLRLEKAELVRQLGKLETGSRADRENCRAALNLMEDALASRRAEQNENAERRRVEEELRQADRQKDEFLATLAHELRNPLAPLSNGIHLLRLTGIDREETRRVYEILERQINHLVRLVEDLMEVSRITRGRIELRREHVELASIVRNAVEANKSLIESAGHQLSINIPTEPLVVNADPVRLAQVFANLLNNAAKYTEEGGRIWLTLRREGMDAVATVRDTGTGIPADMLPRIFDLFTQLDRTYKRAQGGLGIGLTLVRKLMEMHGGTVEARSGGPGEGSEFMLRLPLVTEKLARHSSRPRESRRTDFARRRILIVDDNRDSAESLSLILKLGGADIQIAYDGRTALESVRTHKPSVVLLDIGMPEMDGYEVARRVRAQSDNGDITLIALTGWGQEEDRFRSKQAGFDHHLVKPVDLDALQALLFALPPSQEFVPEVSPLPPADGRGTQG